MRCTQMTTNELTVNHPKNTNISKHHDKHELRAWIRTKELRSSVDSARYFLKKSVFELDLQDLNADTV